MRTKIILDTDEILQGANIGFYRLYRKRQNQSINYLAYCGKWNFQTGINSMLAELGVAKLLGVDWVGGDDSSKFVNDLPYNIEVKYTPIVAGNLILNAQDFDKYANDTKLVLCVGDINDALYCAGWIDLDTFREISTARKTADNRFTYWLSQYKLKSLNSLKTIIKEKKENACTDQHETQSNKTEPF